MIGNVRSFGALWGLLVALFLVAGCTIGNTGFGINIEDGEITATVTISQEAMNKLIGRAGTSVTVHDSEFVEAIHSVDFVAPDTIRVDGVFRLPEGGTTAGVIDFGLDAAAGTVRLEVTDVQGDGISLATPAIRQLNDELASEFEQAVRNEQHSGDGVRSVIVSDEALMVVVTADLRK